MCVGEKQKVIPAQAGVLGTEVSPALLAEMPGHSETEESNCRVGLTGNPLPLFPPPQAPSGCEKEIFPMTFDGRCLRLVYPRNRLWDKDSHTGSLSGRLSGTKHEGRKWSRVRQRDELNWAQLQSRPQPPHGDLWSPRSFTAVLNWGKGAQTTVSLHTDHWM